MKGKRVRIASIVLLLGVIAAIPASTQVLFRSTEASDDAVDLQLLVLVNRMELTAEQMEEIHGILAGLLAERDANELRRAEFEQEMIAFQGTAEELDEILETFRSEMQERTESAQTLRQEAIEQIKEILTAKQGELLDQVFPGFLGDRAGFVQRPSQPFLGRLQADGTTDGRPRALDEMEERLERYPERLERLQQRMDELAASRSGAARFGGRSGVRGSGFDRQATVDRPERGADGLARLLEILELKMEASD